MNLKSLQAWVGNDPIDTLPTRTYVGPAKINVSGDAPCNIRGPPDVWRLIEGWESGLRHIVGDGGRLDWTLEKNVGTAWQAEPGSPRPLTIEFVKVPMSLVGTPQPALVKVPSMASMKRP